MKQYEDKLKKYSNENKIVAEHLVFTESCHSVEEAARAAKADPTDFVKNICLVDSEGRLIVTIVKGEDRVSTTKVGGVLGTQKPRPATIDEVLQKTGYPAGGVPSFGYEAIFLIDERVMEKEIVFSGGGSENSLIKIATKELLRANNGRVVKIRK